jgi:hypothetical protein
MSGPMFLLAKPAKTVAIVVAAVFSISSAAAGATCGLCDTEVVMNSELAMCFLEQYDQLARQDEPAIIVDLSDCPGARGIVEALPSANLTVEEPDTEFMISPEQLSCLKKKLEDPAIELDPSAKIDLASCV